MMAKLAILGASGHGKVIAEIAELNGYHVEFFDDAFEIKSKLEHWSVVGDSEALAQRLDSYEGVIVAIGNNQIREEKLEKLLALGAKTPVLLHPSATISKLANLGEGTVVMAGAVINAFAQIGRGSIINTNATVEHDCFIQDYVHICPSSAIAGGCKIASGVWVGIGSSFKQLIEVGELATIGAGSVVVQNIPAGVTAFGNPAKVVKD